MFYVKKKIHTLTLGEALMPAGLSVEGRIMRHACGPRRAWLKNNYYLLLYYHYLNLAAREKFTSPAALAPASAPVCSSESCQSDRSSGHARKRASGASAVAVAARCRAMFGGSRHQDCSMMVWALLLLPHLFTGFWRA